MLVLFRGCYSVTAVGVVIIVSCFRLIYRMYIHLYRVIDVKTRTYAFFLPDL